MNKVMLVGNILNEVEIGVGKNNTRYVNLMLGIPNGYNFIKVPCVAFDDVAEMVYARAIKGRLISIEGRLSKPKEFQVGDEIIYQIHIIIDKIKTYKVGNIVVKNYNTNLKDEYLIDGDLEDGDTN